MKTKLTLLLIICSLVVMGQNMVFKDIKLMDRTLLSVEDLVEYQKECYMDSIIVGYRYIIEEQGFRMMYMDVYTLIGHPKYTRKVRKSPGSYIRKIEIKEPFKEPTFAGFIEWLKKKYKID